MMNDGLLLGIDVGGTDVKLGLVDCRGEIHRTHRTATPKLGTPRRVFEYAIEYAQSELRTLHGFERVSAVGLAVPGVLDSRVSILREVVNLPDWVNVPLLEMLCDVSQLPSTVINDANSAAFAEHSLRELGDRSLALVTLGTGIGCGVVLAGDPFGGDHGCAGELGHIAIAFGDDALPCTCGSRGHLESYAGASGVIVRLKAALEKSPERVKLESRHPRLFADDVTPRDIAEAAALGDEMCLHIIRETGRFVGQAVGLMGQVVDPAVVLLGGAMTFGGVQTETGTAFLHAVRESVRETTLVQVGSNILIEYASLGNDAGLLGAAMVAKQRALNSG